MAESFSTSQNVQFVYSPLEILLSIAVQCSKLTFSKSRLLAAFNCKMVAITRLSPEFWLPKFFSTRHGGQNGRSLGRYSYCNIHYIKNIMVINLNLAQTSA